MGSAEAAELTKLAETTYRDVNIALANEFARFADRTGIDLDRVIAAANSQPFSHIHRPGVAVGGHCIPVYPRFYLDADADARLPSAAREVNLAMPAYAVDLLEAELGSLAGTRVVILGVAYRGNVKETAFSGAFALRDALTARGAEPLVIDPLYDDDELRALGFEPWDGRERGRRHPAGRPRRLHGPGPERPAGRARGRRRARAARRRALRRGRCGAAAHRRRLSRSARRERGDDARARVPVAVELGALGRRRALAARPAPRRRRGRPARSTRRRRSPPTRSCRASSRTARRPGRPPSAPRPSRSAPRGRARAAP